MLLIQAPDLSMHVCSLLELGRHPPEDAGSVKEAILLISSLRPSEADLEPLAASNIFHVRLANWESAMDEQGSQLLYQRSKSVCRNLQN